jgi:hypothetical protein
LFFLNRPVGLLFVKLGPYRFALLEIHGINTLIIKIDSVSKLNKKSGSKEDFEITSIKKIGG